MRVPALVSAALRHLKSVIDGQVDVTPFLRAPSGYLRRLTSVVGQTIAEHEVWFLHLAGRLADELESRPERLLSISKRSTKWMARDLVADLPLAGAWLEYFRAVERELPGAVVLATARAIVRLAGVQDERFPQFLSRIPAPLRGEGVSAEEHARRELDWLGKVIEGVFAPVALDALSFVESLRTGKAIFRQEARGARYEQLIESLKTAACSATLDGDLFRIRNAIEHDSFQASERSFVLIGRKGKTDWSHVIAFEHIGLKGRDVLFTTAAIALSMYVVMLESAPALLLNPAIVNLLTAALRGLDTAPFDSDAEAAFMAHLHKTLLQVERVG